MSYPYTSVGTDHANVTLLDDGDQVNKSSLSIGIHQRIWDKVMYVRSLVVAIAATAWTFTVAQIFQARVTLSGDAAILVKRYGAVPDANGSLDLTKADVWRVPTALTGARAYVLTKPSAALAGFSCRVFRSKTASAHTVGFSEASPSRSVGAWSASKGAWADFVWDGTNWHMCGYDVGGTDNGTSDTSDP